MKQTTAKTRLHKTRKLKEARRILQALDFEPRQSNEVAGYVLLAMLDLSPAERWQSARAPLRGITPIIEFILKNYGVQYAPNTRETIRDEAVKYFVELGLLVKNPDKPTRPTNSGRTVYQVEPGALALCRTYETKEWNTSLTRYVASRKPIIQDLRRARSMARIPLLLPSGKTVSLSPGGQNPLIKAFVEQFCSRFVPGGLVLYVGDAESKFRFFDAGYLARLGVTIEPSVKMPDVVVHDPKRKWLVIGEAVTSAGVVDGKRRRELKKIFAGFRSGLVFVTAFETRSAMCRFAGQVSWETEVWIAEDPNHVIHFNGQRFLGPYPDTVSE